MTNLTELKEQIKQVARAREEARKLADEKEAAYRLWAEANQTLLNDADEAKLYQADQEAKLRELTLEAYHETGEKKPAPGVGIRETTRLVYEVPRAHSWAMEHKMALKLDVAAFEKIAKVDPPEFVSVEVIPQATIAQELKVE